MGTTGVIQVLKSLEINIKYIPYDPISDLARALETKT